MKRQALSIVAVLSLSLPQYSHGMAQNLTQNTVRKIQEKSITCAQQSIQTSVKRAKILSYLTLGSVIGFLGVTVGPKLKDWVMNKIDPKSEPAKPAITLEKLYEIQLKTQGMVEQITPNKVWTVLAPLIITGIGSLAIRGIIEKIMYLMVPAEAYSSMASFIRTKTSMSAWYDIVMTDATMIAQDEVSPEQRTYAINSLIASCNRLMGQVCTILGYMKFRIYVLKNQKQKERVASAQLIEEYLFNYTNDFVDSLNKTFQTISVQQKSEEVANMLDGYFNTVQNEIRRFAYIEKDDEDRIAFEGIKSPFPGPGMDPAIAAMMQ